MSDASDVAHQRWRSIGDVLSVLESEFPDISISKIRYLESQGLVSPSRAESGYRQFDDEKLNDDLILKGAIRPITGATLTARSTTDAVRRALAIHHVITGGGGGS